MKTKIVVQVFGNAPENWTEDDEAHIRSLEPNADLIEIITTKTGHFDVLDAWRDLLSKGISLVTCKMAVFSECIGIRIVIPEKSNLPTKS